MDVRQRAQQAVSDAVEEGFEQFRVDARDFLPARELGEAVSTRIDQRSAALADAAEILGRSFPEKDAESGQFTNVISPVVMPKGRFALWPFIVGFAAVIRLLVSAVALGGGGGIGMALVGPHFWLLLFAIFAWWRRSLMMVPEGCQALVTKFGKLE